MTRALALLLFLATNGLQAQVVPGMFIVRMADAGKTAAREAAAEKQSVRLAVEQTGGAVISSLDTVMNALVVKTDDSQQAAIASIPGVAKVYRVYEVHLTLDKALPLHHVPEAWMTLGGFRNAGRGVRIAIVDSGIEVNHPGFTGSDLPMPDGFPRGNRNSDLAGTSNKIIVARSYENLIDPYSVPTTDDVLGHGTALAMVAAGLPSHAPYADISGVAPMAYLGSYKVFAGTSGTARTDVIIRAMDDAVRDGMDIINLSLGVFPAPAPADDALVQAVESAFQEGVIVVCSAGNSGPNPNTMTSPAGAADVIAVGANANSRTLAATATVGAAPPYLGKTGDYPVVPDAVQAPPADVATLDADGEACSALPGGSLAGKIALILRGTCFFEDKLNHAQQAGAVAAIVYTDDRPVVTMSVGAATLPALMVSHEDGLAIKARLAAETGIEARLVFQGSPFPFDPYQLTDFTSRGPSEQNGIRPDLVAVGQDVYTAAETINPAGEIYSPDGYSIVDGTSFSSPLVAGAAAVLMSARPGLSPAQYRSMLINSASPLLLGGDQPAGAQGAGAGLLNLDAALNTTATAYPTALSFGAGGATASRFQLVTITNTSATAGTFSIVAEPLADAPAPVVSPGIFTLGPGASRTVGVLWAVSGLTAGQYQGDLHVTGSHDPAGIRIPYWYAVTSPEPAYLTLMQTPTSARRGSIATVWFRVTDASGVILTDLTPTVTVEEGGGSADSIQLIDYLYPGVWSARLRMGPASGTQVFRIHAGNVSSDVSISVN